MNRNSNARFALNPNVDIQRSRFDRSSQHKTTFNTGELIPVFIDEVLPGDTFEMKTAAIVRGSTPIFPVMDNSFLDIYYFFVPNRLVWEHWKEFNGENTTTAWEQTIEYQIPQINPPTNGWQKGDLADYFGIPTQISPGSTPAYSINALPLRAYCLIYNEFFRDQNLTDPVLIDIGDSALQGVTGTGGTNVGQSALAGGAPLKAAKPHDYFTSALPEPQKGPAVLLPLGGTAPVTVTNEETTNLSHLPTGQNAVLKFVNNWGEGASTGTYNAGFAPQSDGILQLGAEKAESGFVPSLNLQPANLQANLSEATAATINELRLAFQIQKLFEKDARGGTRYIEILKAHFGVTSPDARLQRPEYLGGEHIPINVDQVVQTSASVSGETPQGNTAAFSLTGFHGAGFTKSFVEHGYLLGLAVVRTEHTYQQGLEKLWSRKTRFNFYWPALANIGEQAILNKEIFLTGNETMNNEAFGYQEAWAEYRYKPSRVSGAFRSNYAQSLDAWHYADYYEAQPMLSSSWIEETTANVDRTLAVQSELEDQWLADFAFRCICTRPMPLYSIPGLIDHN